MALLPKVLAAPHSKATNPLLPQAARLVPSPAVGSGAGLSLGVVGERSGPGGRTGQRTESQVGKSWLLEPVGLGFRP